MYQTIATAALIAAIVCFILVMMELYARKQTTLMIVCIVLAFFGVGLLVGCIYGWINVKNWRLYNIMYIYTGALVVMVLFGRSLLPAFLFH